MLNSYEIENVIDRAKDAIEEQIFLANRTGRLEELLCKIGLSNLIKKDSAYDTEKDGIIVVVGQSEVKLNVLHGIIKSLELDKNRFEFCLNYGDSKTFNYKKMQYNPKYRVVIFGPVPHSTTGKNDSNSVITEMQKKEGYPRVVVLNGSNGLKITKSAFKNALKSLIAEDYS